LLLLLNLLSLLSPLPLLSLVGAEEILGNIEGGLLILPGSILSTLTMAMRLHLDTSGGLSLGCN
jgi:hypothetical protein